MIGSARDAMTRTPSAWLLELSFSAWQPDGAASRGGEVGRAATTKDQHATASKSSTTAKSSRAALQSFDALIDVYSRSA